ncbi:MAG: Ldh family oxidoreductase [SAR202 cluster bacterium]|nr:Ldh family oxidoreductase [SAR202 cluster bacterium]|tara:strand:- start:52392 stop:53462 length:1071 start_codon:yes stop_codon:yes gene_type:complete
MPILDHEKIYSISKTMLSAKGATINNADIVARHLSNANLVGHDSHGLIRIPQYFNDIETGRLDPKASPEITSDNGSTVQVNGNDSFGQVVASFSTQLAIDKAKKHGVSVIGMGNLGHTGRIGTYTEIVADAGMVGMMFTGFVGGNVGNNVAPFGGSARRLGTNPLSMAFPYKKNCPILIDFATSISAEGKLRVYKARNKKLPDNWVIDKNGTPTDDPNAYYEGGAILPIGGTIGGHKGFGLSMMVSLMGAVLGSIGLTSADNKATVDKVGSSILVINLNSISSIDDFSQEVSAIVNYVKDTPKMEGVNEILFPGEIEFNTRSHRITHGVEIEDATWGAISKLAKNFNIDINDMKTQ